MGVGTILEIGAVELLDPGCEDAVGFGLSEESVGSVSIAADLQRGAGAAEFSSLYGGLVDGLPCAGVSEKHYYFVCA